MFIYLDESGDLGFDSAKRNSKKFVITILVCYTEEARKDIRKAVRRTLKNKLNSKKGKSCIVFELKGAKTAHQIKEYFLKAVKNDQWEIYALALNKSRVEPPLQTATGKKKLYNFLSRQILQKVPLSRALTNVELVVDRSKSKEEIRDFNQYLINQLEGRLPLKTTLNPLHLDSEDTPELQAADLFCWGIFRKYEYNDTRWYQLFRRKIKYETEYLGGK